MKRFYALTIAAAGAALSLSAQSKFDLPAAMLVSDGEITSQAHARSRAGETVNTIDTQTDPTAARLVLVMLNDDFHASQLREAGFDVEDSDSKTVFARLTPAEMQEVAKFDGVKQIALGYGAQPLLNTARATAGVDAAHAGTDPGLNGHSYTGAGVITGLMDVGMDINHVNFLDANNKPRTKALWTIQSSSGVVTPYLTESAITGFDTDNNEESHATHVLGIMAGSFNGRPADRNSGLISYLNPTTKKLVSTFNTTVPYYGVAKNAEPAVCIGTLDGSNISLAAKYISEYAAEQGKPAVMNMSLGNNRGPHDGTDAESQKIAEYGKKMLICISAGNEGNYNISLRKVFTASDNTLKSTIANSATASGYIDIWGDNASVLKVTFVAVNKLTGEIGYSYELNKNLGGQSIYITGNDYTSPNYIHDTKFNQIFGGKGALILSSSVSATNNRYNVYANVSLKGSASNYVPAFIIEGSAGNGVNAFAGNSGSLQFRSNGLSGYVNGTPDQSINGMACGDNVLIVGSYNNAVQVPTLGGILTYNGMQQGDISAFSSYGTTFQGRQLPDITGPGLGMISSYSKYYVENSALGISTGDMSAWINNPNKVQNQVRKDYWGEMSGTSMSSPFVAGVLALWLEADPTLTMDRVKEILKKTADHDEFTAVAPHRWGMGKINALAGLKEILGTGSVNTVMADDADKKLIIEPVGGKCYNVFVGGTDGFTANLYNMQGALTATASASGNSTTIDASSLSEGIYLLEVHGKNIHTSRKFVVK